MSAHVHARVHDFLHVRVRVRGHVRGHDRAQEDAHPHDGGDDDFLKHAKACARNLPSLLIFSSDQRIPSIVCTVMKSAFAF